MLNKFIKYTQYSFIYSCKYNIFSLAIPPPTPSNRNQYNYGRGGYTQTTNTAPVQMQQYFNASGGCFTQESFVYKVLVSFMGLDKDKDLQVVEVQVKDLVPGDFVMTKDGISMIECLVALKYAGPLYTSKIILL